MSRRRSFPVPVRASTTGGSKWRIRDSYVAKIEANGGTIISEPGEGALKFRAPDGTVAEIVGVVQKERRPRRRRHDRWYDGESEPIK
jgi:hypothetical protein